MSRMKNRRLSGVVAATLAILMLIGYALRESKAPFAEAGVDQSPKTSSAKGRRAGSDDLTSFSAASPRTQKEQQGLSGLTTAVSPSSLKNSMEDESLNRALATQKLSREELLASHRLASLMVDASRKQFDLRSLLQRMREMGLKPDARREVNPVTGRSYIIRSTSFLPGTRHFHAQVFENSQGGEFVQHLSFDLRPGADSLSSAVSIVRGLLPAGARLVSDQPDFKAWTLGDGYMAWIKVLSAEDLEGDPYDAYSFPQDRGTIKIAIEEDVEDQHSMAME
jgi:hypothetical protein